MTNTRFDLIVVGTGPAASKVAKKCRGEGKTVAIIEAREFGGTCALRGCNPKKVYSNAANLVDRTRGATDKFLDCKNLSMNWERLLRFKREFTDPVPANSEESYRERGIETFHGVASFAGRNSVKLDGRVLEADRIFIGTGSHPRPLDIPGGKRAMLSDEFLELDEIPKRVVFIGGGYISMEFACIVARYGVAVTVLQRTAQVLTQFDPELVCQLVNYSAQHGITVQSSARVKRIDGAGAKAMTVQYEKAGKTSEVEADLVVHGAGRIPNFDGLNLSAGGVEFTKKGIQVDPHMRSISNPSVFAAGDCAGFWTSTFNTDRP